MKIYKLEQNERNGYDSVIVIAENEESARKIHPSPYEDQGWNYSQSRYSSWCSSPDKVFVTEIGTANPDQKPGVILASFNAG